MNPKLTIDFRTVAKIVVATLACWILLGAPGSGLLACIWLLIVEKNVLDTLRRLKFRLNKAAAIFVIGIPLFILGSTGIRLALVFGLAWVTMRLVARFFKPDPQKDLDELDTIEIPVVHTGINDARRIPVVRTGPKDAQVVPVVVMPEKDNGDSGADA